MKTLSWADVAVDKHYDDALNTIFHAIQTFARDGAQPTQLACALLEGAQDVMNYHDPLAAVHDGAWQHDAEFVQLNRLMNFMESMAEFTEKRLALVHKGDRYMEQKVEAYQAIITPALKVAQEMEHEVLQDRLDGLSRDLIIKGVSRATLARALVDAAFVLAKQQSTADFVKFCTDLKMMLGRGGELSNSFEADVFEADTGSIHATAQGSTLIH